MKKNKTILSLKEVRKRSKKFLFQTQRTRSFDKPLF